MRVSRFATVRASALGALGITVLTLAGCASLGPVQEGNAPVASPVLATASPTPPLPPPSPFPSSNDSMLPRMIIPATGGPPVLGIPLTTGGNIFLPVTGGPPVIGMPLLP
jgi:hypothetical protein